MALNSPGPGPPSPHQRTPKSANKFTFPIKASSINSSTSSSGYFTPQSGGSRPPRSPIGCRTYVGSEQASPVCNSPTRLQYSASLKHRKSPPPIHIHRNPVFEKMPLRDVSPRRFSEKRLVDSPSIISIDTNADVTTANDADDEASLASSRICHNKSTSDLTTIEKESQHTRSTSISRPSSPRRHHRGSIKSGLAFLASRRSSRDSVVSNCDSVEDIGPLNFQNTARGRQRRTSNFLELPVVEHTRPRVCSLPDKPYNPRASDSLYRLRTFSITDKGGIVNRGDSICTRSNTSVNSTASRASDRSPFEGSCCSGYRAVDSNSLTSPDEDEIDPVPKYRVILLGDVGVGKTALVSQFMTSEYMNTYDASLDDEFGEKSVSVLLDGEESEMIFIDHPAGEMSVENSLSTYEPHACIVVYSIEDRGTFRKASDILTYLARENFMAEKSVIVVGNKADLARARQITTHDGKALATFRDCKFIETSSGIQHNVDELLVGVLKQIRLKEAKDKKQKKKESKPTKLSSSRTQISLNIAREILQKICLNDISKSKSCENLHVL